MKPIKIPQPHTSKIFRWAHPINWMKMKLEMLVRPQHPICDTRSAPALWLHPLSLSKLWNVQWLRNQQALSLDLHKSHPAASAAKARLVFLLPPCFAFTSWMGLNCVQESSMRSTATKKKKKKKKKISFTLYISFYFVDIPILCSKSNKGAQRDPVKDHNWTLRHEWTCSEEESTEPHHWSSKSRPEATLTVGPLFWVLGFLCVIQQRYNSKHEHLSEAFEWESCCLLE